ncbi:MAG TPA: ATP-dependent protease ATPase subunit HslU, partial [Tepidisphaeraceae bacterium]|nr:ATP-dependent protease ATPase subunit HslU [Tepidisphaeraceae bacterium]
MQHLTPKEIVAELDRYIVGQTDAKRAVAVAIRNRWRRQQLPEGLRQDVAPKNIIMIGPTGVGKTEIARRLAGLTGAPFIKVEATKYTEVGYHGRDVESMVRDLLDAAIQLVRTEMTEQVKESAAVGVEDRLLDMLLPQPTSPYEDDETREKRTRTREKMREQLRAGQLEDADVEIVIEDKPTAQGMLGSMALEMDVQMQSMFERMLPSKRETKRFKVKDARQVLFNQVADTLLNKDQLMAAAIERTEEAGIIFLDEIDKVCGVESKNGPDVSRGGVQRDLLPIVEGSTVVTKHGSVRTDHVLFIAAGAFHDNSPSDLMPELQGRFPIRVELSDLRQE